MTKKHFAAVAASIYYQVSHCNERPEVIATLTALAEDLAAEFKRFNSNFDSGRFLTACGV